VIMTVLKGFCQLRVFSSMKTCSRRAQKQNQDLWKGIIWLL